MGHVLVSPRHQKLLLKDDPAVANIVPDAVRRDGYLVLDHGPEQTRLLRNLGYEAPAPILSQYDWRNTKPFDSQRETAALLTMNKRAYVLNTMGTGKTRASLYAADFLMQRGEATSALIVAPLSTLTPTWMNEIFFNFHHRSAVVLHGTKKKRQQLLAESHDFYIINHDGLQVLLPELEADDRFNLVILDELAMFRETRTDRWKIARKIIKDRKYVWGLTGAPTPNGPTDAYGQIKLLQPNKVGTFGRFRDATMHKITQFKWVPKKDSPEYVHNLMQPSVRYKLEDCVDIPDTTYSDRDVKMSKVQEKFYKRLNSAAAAAYAQHEVTAANEGVVMNKLLQVSCGWVYTDEGRVLGLSPKAKLKELTDVVEEADRKIIVFVPYRHAIASVAMALTVQGYSVGVVHGGISKTERDTLFYQFQHSDDPHVLVAHPRTMSHGLTLTESNTIVWYCPTTSLDTYIQANARIVRTGQRYKTSIIHLRATPVEKKVYARLQRNEAVQGSLLELYDGVDDGS